MGRHWAFMDGSTYRRSVIEASIIDLSGGLVGPPQDIRPGRGAVRRGYVLDVSYYIEAARRPEHAHLSRHFASPPWLDVGCLSSDCCALCSTVRTHDALRTQERTFSQTSSASSPSGKQA